MRVEVRSRNKVEDEKMRMKPPARLGENVKRESSYGLDASCIAIYIIQSICIKRYRTQAP